MQTVSRLQQYGMSSLSSPFDHRFISLRRVLSSRDRNEGYLSADKSSIRPPLHNQLATDEHTTCATTPNTTRILQKSNRAACDEMPVVQLMRLQEIFIVLQLLLLLPLPLLHASRCPTVVQRTVVATTLDADNLAEHLLCEGPGRFAVSWHGDVKLSRTLSVSNGTHLNVTGSSESTGAVIISDGTVLLLEVDLGSTVLLTGLTFSGGDGALRVAGESFVKVIDCSYLHNNRTSSGTTGGKPAVLLVLCMSPRKHSEQSKNKRAKLPTLKHTWVLILLILILTAAPACSFETLT